MSDRFLKGALWEDFAYIIKQYKDGGKLCNGTVSLCLLSSNKKHT